MKQYLLLAAGLFTAASMSAGWGQDMTSPVDLFPTGTGSYATEVVSTPEGGVWTMVYHPNLRNAESEYDIDKVVYEYRVQYFDPQGNPQFPAEGLLVSDYENWSYTVVNQYLASDKEGNLILSVLDCRNSGEGMRSYTAYKISPKGEFLWGEEGKPITDPTNPAYFCAAMKFVELTDGSWVFAWMEFDDVAESVHLQRLDKDGNPTWSKDKVADSTDNTSYPYLVETGDNTFIMVYAKSSSRVIYARKMDFEGESVWGKDTRIYRGGWGSIPIHTLISVAPSNNGGVIVGWNDDRSNSNIEHAYMSYVTSDGKLGFAGQSDEADCRLSYSDVWRKFNVSIVAAEDASCFYAVWRNTNGSQTLQGMSIQKVSLKGDLLWGDEGMDLHPVDDEASFGYVSVCNAPDNGVCAFYEAYFSYFDQRCMASYLDTEGNFVWDEPYLFITLPSRKASALEGYNYMGLGDGKWLYTWTDGGTSAEDKAETYQMNILNADGTVGVDNSGVENVSESARAPFGFDGKNLCGSFADGTPVTVFDAAGVKVASSAFVSGKVSLSLSAGVYFASTGGRTVKFFVR